MTVILVDPLRPAAVPIEAALVRRWIRQARSPSGRSSN
jgi:hypothetical protein